MNSDPGVRAAREPLSLSLLFSFSSAFPSVGSALSLKPLPAHCAMLLSPRSIPAAMMCPMDPAASTSTKVMPVGSIREKKKERIESRDQSVFPTFPTVKARPGAGVGSGDRPDHPLRRSSPALQGTAEVPTRFITLTKWVSREHVTPRVLEVESLLELGVLRGAWRPSVPHGEEHDEGSGAHGLGRARAGERDRERRKKGTRALASPSRKSPR